MKKAVLPVLILALSLGILGCSTTNTTVIETTEQSSIVETTIDTFTTATSITENTTTTGTTASSRVTEDTEVIIPEIPTENVVEETPQGTYVWITRTGECYHNNPACSNMQNPSEVMLEYAESQGYRPCSNCYTTQSYVDDSPTDTTPVLQEEPTTEPEIPTATSVEYIEETTTETTTEPKPFTCHDLTWSFSEQGNPLDDYGSFVLWIATNAIDDTGDGCIWLDCSSSENIMPAVGVVWVVIFESDLGQTETINVYFVD